MNAMRPACEKNVREDCGVVMLVVLATLAVPAMPNGLTMDPATPRLPQGVR